MKIAFVASPMPQAQEALRELERRYGGTSVEEADAIVVLGGDGHVLKTLHGTLGMNKGIYALRRTQSVGFLCNDYDAENLLERVERAQHVTLHPMRVTCKGVDGSEHEAIAINEVTLLRDSLQSAKMSVSVDGIERLARFSGDGLLVATPAGSTAYNHSAGGPIMPLDSNTLVMTAICGFRPRRWSYAILPQNVSVDIKVLETEKRPVRVEAGFSTLHNIASASIKLDTSASFTLLFDPNQHLSERIIQEQFMS